MSQKYPYTIRGDDFQSREDMYRDAYQRQSSTYRPSVRSLSLEQTRSTIPSNRSVDSPVQLPGALSFLYSCGLDSSDIAHLAEIPEHLFTTETLSSLLLQIKERKLPSAPASSFRPSTIQTYDTLARAWEGSAHTTSVDYLIGEGSRHTTSVDYLIGEGSRHTTSVDYPIGEGSRHTTSVDYLIGERSRHTTSVDYLIGEGSRHTTSVDYLIDRSAPPVYPFPPKQGQTWQDRRENPRQKSSSRSSSSVPDYNVYQNTNRYHSATESAGASSRSFVDGRPKSLLSLKLEPPVFGPTRRETSDFHCKIPQAFPHVCRLCDISVRSTKDWFSHVRGNQHVKSQLDLLKKYPKWAQTVDFAGRNESLEVYKVPTRTEASDFNGVPPPVFPYLCVLCNITVFSEKDWSGHVTGGQHAQSQLDLMAKYPEWDGAVQSSRRNDGHTSTDIRDGTSREKASDMMSQEKNEPCSQVVSFSPLPVGEGIATELTAIAKRFGSIRKSLFLPNRGYVEMGCLAEARKLVEHYSAYQLKLKGKLIQVTYSYDYNSLREAKGNDNPHSWGSHTQRRSPSPRNRHSSEKKRSSPKRKHSSERSHSSTKRRRSSERTHSSGSPNIKDGEDSQKVKENDSLSVHPYNSSSSAAKSTNNNNVIVGLADEGEELAHKPTTSHQRKLPSESMDVTDIHSKQDDSPNVDPPEASNSLKEGQRFKEEDHDCPNILEKCLALDELMEGNSSACQESGETKALISETEQSDKESKSPKEESINKTTAEHNNSENPEDTVVQPKEEHDTEGLTDDLKETFKEDRSVENDTGAAPPSKKSEKEKPSVEKALSVPPEGDEDQEKKENDSEVNTVEHNTSTTETQTVALKTAQKVESGIDVAPTESSSVVSSADVSEKSQEPTEAPTPPTESVKQPESTTEALGPYEPNVPVGVEFVKMGYYCRVCFLFYSKEDTAKKIHCSSQAHYEKLKTYLEKEKAKAPRNRKKN